MAGAKCTLSLQELGTRIRRIDESGEPWWSKAGKALLTRSRVELAKRVVSLGPTEEQKGFYLKAFEEKAYRAFLYV
jgi:hypothetical protein